MQNDSIAKEKWSRRIWTGAAISMLCAIAALTAFASITVTNVMATVSHHGSKDLSFAFAGISLVTLTLLRFIAILIGAAIAFAGLAVSFYTHDTATQANATLVEGKVSASLGTHAPGLFGVAFGAMIICLALYAKSEHQYKSPQTVTINPFPAANAASSALKSEKELLNSAPLSSADHESGKGK
jgi:hypothetical protein